MRHVIKVGHLPLDGAHFRDEHHYIPRYYYVRGKCAEGCGTPGVVGMNKEKK